MPNSEWSRRPIDAPGFRAFGQSDRGGVTDDFETGSTGADFQAFGVTSFGSTAAKTYDMEPPARAGIWKVLFCRDASTAAIQKVRASTGGAVDYTSTAGLDHIAAFNSDGETLVLMSVSTILWAIVSNQGAVVLSTA